MAVCFSYMKIEMECFLEAGMRRRLAEKRIEDDGVSVLALTGSSSALRITGSHVSE